MLYFFFLCINMVIYVKKCITFTMNHVLSVTNCTSCTSIKYVIKCTYTKKTLILVQKGFCVIFHAHTALFHFEPLLKSYMEHRKSAQIEISIFIIKQTSVTVPSGLSIIHSIIHSVLLMEAGNSTSTN